ncbi:MAG: SusC/RagA family TonB-linked outer membrane protein [Gemmatimonadales bacterium]|nr:MAG: SusC/RagA family TonB-linked outer membrane protein [Gemmatimonadales bacterium]
MFGRSFARATLGAFLLLVFALPAHAQSGEVVGQVTSADTGQPLAAAQVFLEGTGFGVVTSGEGRYTISNVPAGTYTVVVRLIGYADARRENIVVRPGEPTTIDLQLRSQALRLQEVVVTGVTDPTEGTRVPFTVARVSRDDLPVPSSNAVAALQGRVAGARVVSGGGQPGSGVSVRLRNRLSVNTGAAPLIVVDGVIQAASTVDIDPNDIESLEVVKGAAAASLYGARAQNGVIQIQTRRGRDVPLNATRITARSELGFGSIRQLPGVALAHQFLQNEQGQWVDMQGNVVDRQNRVIQPSRMMDQPYRTQTFDNFDRFFDAGRTSNTTVNLSRNMESTNFFFSAGDYRETGIVPDFNSGYERQNFRINLDHRIRDDLTLGLTSYYARSARDNLTPSPFFSLRFFPPDIDLNIRDEDGDFKIQPDPSMLENNPLYPLTAVDSWNWRSRTQGSAQLRYSPLSWLNFEGILSFDRSDRESATLYPKGYKTVNPGQLNDGQYTRSYAFDQSLNGTLQTSQIRTFGDLTARTRIRYNFERDDFESQQAQAREFRVFGLRSLNNGIQEFTSGSSNQVRSESLLGALGLDYGGRYIFDALIRQDGSSLFGPDDRWNTYYRVAAAWRMAEEDWWPFLGITEFKPRFSQGTAGARPGFSWRYETWSVGTAGPSKGQLGNRALRPELTTEREYGLDMIIQDRFSIELVYADTEVQDQLIPIPLPGVFGFSSQWQNAGVVDATAYEATFEAILVSQPEFSWRAGMVFDRTRSVLRDWPRSCYVTSVFYRCEGEDFGSMYGRSFMTSANDLQRHLGGRFADFADQFQVNDDGYLVPVGNANWTDGLSGGLWGTQVNVDGVNLPWGLPIVERDESGVFAQRQIGDANANFNLGFTNNFQWRGIQIYSLFDWKNGGDIYNETRQWPYRDNISPDQVQTGKPDERKKPIDYYEALYNTNSTNSHFVEDGSYVKLRELSVAYRFNQSQLQRFIGGLGMSGLSVELIGRNLLTFTNYSGDDPEVGSGGAGGVTENPFDSFGYPNFRTLTLGITIDF